MVNHLPTTIIEMLKKVRLLKMHLHILLPLKKQLWEEDNDLGPKYQCLVCDHIYDPKDGDPDGGIKHGTRFEDIPDDWVCPVCGAEKSDFEVLE